MYICIYIYIYIYIIYIYVNTFIKNGFRRITDKINKSKTITSVHTQYVNAREIYYIIHTFGKLLVGAEGKLKTVGGAATAGGASLSSDNSLSSNSSSSANSANKSSYDVNIYMSI
jgi:hypothetical protein